MVLAMGYSLAQTNDLAAQNAEMVLFVRKDANISISALDKLRTVGWKLRVEDDLVFKDVDIEKIRPWHRWNLNKIRFWSWTDYDQILFIDADAIVKGDLSEIWDTPGSAIVYGIADNSNRGGTGRMGLHRKGHPFQLWGAFAPAIDERVFSPPPRAVNSWHAPSGRRRPGIPQSIL